MLLKLKKYKNSITIIGFILLFTPLIIGVIITTKEKKELEDNGVETMGLAVKFAHGRFMDCFYEIHINDTIYTSSIVVHHRKECCIGTFYKVIYSPNDPSISKILLDKPISRDSLAYYFKYYNITPANNSKNRVITHPDLQIPLQETP